MPDWLGDFLGGAQSFIQGTAAWNYFMGVVETLMGLTPEEQYPEAWNYVTETLYPWMLSIGLVLLNLFCLIGFIRQASNLKENVTIEMWVELFIKLLIANGLMTNGLTLMQEFFKAANLLSTDIMSAGVPAMYNQEADLGAVLMYVLIGLIYIIVSVICGILIVVEVLGRFLNLFMLTATMPVAMSTLAGGRGIENTAYAWIKSFLCNVFQIVVIAIILQIGGKMIAVTGNIDNAGNISDWFDGAGAVCMSFLNMIFITTAVKGSDNFLKRVFDLR